MALNLDMLRGLIRTALLHGRQAIDCDECLKKIDEYAENVLANRDHSDALVLVKEHLEICVECREEFEMLLTAPEGMEPA